MKGRSPFRLPFIKSEEEHYDRKTLLDAIKDRACEQGYSYGRPKEPPESSGNYHLSCSEERCKHSILVSRASEDEPWTLRIIKNDHNHQPITDITRVPDIAPRIVKLILESRWDPKDVRTLVRDQTGLGMTKGVVNRLLKRWKTHKRLTQPLVTGVGGNNTESNTGKRQAPTDDQLPQTQVSRPTTQIDTQPTRDHVPGPSKRPHRIASTRHAKTNPETNPEMSSEETESESDDDDDDSPDYVDKSYSHKPPPSKRLRTGLRPSLQVADVGPSSTQSMTSPQSSTSSDRERPSLPSILPSGSSASILPSGSSSSVLPGRSSDAARMGTSSRFNRSSPRPSPPVTPSPPAEKTEGTKGKAVCRDTEANEKQELGPARVQPRSLDDGLKQLLALKANHETKVAHHKAELARYQADLRSVEEKIDIMTEEAALEEMAARREELQRQMEQNNIEMEARKRKIAELRAREEGWVVSDTMRS